MVDVCSYMVDSLGWLVNFNEWAHVKNKVTKI